MSSQNTNSIIASSASTSPSIAPENAVNTPAKRASDGSVSLKYREQYSMMTVPIPETMRTNSHASGSSAKLRVMPNWGIHGWDSTRGASARTAGECASRYAAVPAGTRAIGRNAFCFHHFTKKGATSAIAKCATMAIIMQVVPSS